MLDEESPTAGAGPLVLVVDDEPEPRSAVCRMVRGLGYGARDCESGRQALRYLEAQPKRVKLLVADLGMPRMDGGELVERARDLDPELRVALMVDPADARTPELLAGYRDLPALAKPVRFADLYGRLRQLLGPPPMAPTHSSSARSRSTRRPSGRHET